MTIWRLQALQSMGAFSNIRLEGKMQVRLPTGVRRQLLRYYAAVQRFRSGPGPSPWLLQALFWVVHSHTVIDATRAAKKLQSSLRDGERQFALGWGRIMVRVLAEANFSTAQAAVGPINQQCLPQRVCNASDIDPASPSDLPPAQRETVLAIARLYRARDWSFLYLPLLEIGAVILNCIMRVEQQFESGCSSIKNGGVP
ncbi:MAG TPA: hypothetical protein VME66_15270 [Candidatus Acidoferrales bacterium]|nr:hypothetical protein [Candidatus Acidoferrales bacterium]